MGFDSLGDEGIGVVVELELELDEPIPLVLEPAPVPGVDVSAPGAGVGIGAVVVEGEDAGGGVTIFSSFLLQAVRLIATRATARSERFIFFPLGRASHGLDGNRTNGSKSSRS